MEYTVGTPFIFDCNISLNDLIILCIYYYKYTSYTNTGFLEEKQYLYNIYILL